MKAWTPYGSSALNKAQLQARVEELEQRLEEIYGEAYDEGFDHGFNEASVELQRSQKTFNNNVSVGTFQIHNSNIKSPNAYVSVQP